VKNRTVLRARTVTAVAAAVLAGSLTLAGCSSSSSDSSSPSPSATSTTAATTAATASPADVAALKAVSVTGKPGKKPTIKFSKGLTVSTPVARVDTKGTGKAIKPGDMVGFNIAVSEGSDGKSVADTYEQAPQYYIDNASSGLPTALVDALKGQKVGTRIVFANPSQDQEGKAVTYVYSFEVASTQSIPARASGTKMKQKSGLPAVKLSSSGAPSITIPKDYKAPKKLVSETLIKGKGEKVKSTSAVAVNYTGWTMKGKKFDSSWDRGTPMAAALNGGVIKGWTQGLAGQTVGSQVLLVVPASLAYGASPPSGSGIAKNATLIFVVDILASGN
jgi:peptidylprolyl isomerase